MRAATGCAISAATRDQRRDLPATATVAEDERPDAAGGVLEFMAGLHVEVAWTRQTDIDDFRNAPWAGRHYDHPVREQHRFGDRVGDKQDGLRPLLPDAHQLDGQLLARQGIKRAARLLA